MGASKSRVQDTKEDSELDRELAKALQIRHASRKDKGAGKGVKSFESLVMKFGHIEKGLVASRELFKRLDTDRDGLIDLSEFSAACPSLGIDLTVDALKRYFAAADMDHSSRVDPREFILLLAVVVLLEEQPVKISEDIIKALEIVEEYFFFFDSSHDGYMDRDEVMKAMEDHSHNKSKKASMAVVNDRFKELDWDDSGRISFKEFLFGVQSWVQED